MTRRELHIENVRLDAENRQLRGWLTNMLLVVARRDELLELGLQEIEQRWPETSRRRKVPEKFQEPISPRGEATEQRAALLEQAA